ncbi:MAG: hypothetical protein GC199_08450 [Alphaproteobacteria bacterium]|nr:hypothetical protein [Alphaproteobacteria bacterium]
MLKSMIARLFSADRPEPAAAQTVAAPAPAEKKPDPTAHAFVLDGLKHAQAGDAVAAVESFQSGFIAFQQRGDRRNAALCQKVVSLLLDAFADVKKAAKAWARTRELLARAGLKDEEARVLHLQSHFEARHRHYDEAFRCLREARALYRDIGKVEEEIAVLKSTAELQASRGRQSEAKRAGADAFALIETLPEGEARDHLAADLRAYRPS